MIEWGISAASHNAALAVFVDRQLVFASESERFSKIKNDPNLDPSLVEYARRWGEPSRVYWYERPWLKTLRQLRAGQGFVNNNVKSYLAKYGIRAPISTAGHHHSHAAAGYYTSTFDQACVVVIDAVGEFETLTIWQAQGPHLKKIYAQQYPHSIGLWYSAMTQRVGLKPNEDEYVLMGMAAYGDPDRFYSSVKQDFVKYTWPRLFTFNQNLHRGCKQWRPDIVTEQDHYDLAAAVQRLYEELFESVLAYAQYTTGSKNLVLGGGCALNCSANPAAFKYFDRVWIMPAPGDNGSSIGAVLAHYQHHIEWPGVYLGYDMGYKTSNQDIVDHLLKHSVCGLARGQAEFGPRALGNRSLLADPRDPKIKVLINQIKRRQQFRPFAPSILKEFAKTVFLTPTESIPYMQFICGFAENDSYLSVRHHDNTARVHTVDTDQNPQFRELLEIWYHQTGCPLLLNTSLNIRGQPMVNDHEQASEWSRIYNVPVFT
jgi:carbamoyltransferase